MGSTIDVIAIEKDGVKTIVNKKTITHDLDSIHEFVGGYFEVIPAFPDGDAKGVDLLMVLNEEGKLKSLAPTIAYVKNGQILDFIAGNAFVTRKNGDDFGSVSDEDVVYFKHRYGNHAIVESEGIPHHVLVFDGK